MAANIDSSKLELEKELEPAQCQTRSSSSSSHVVIESAINTEEKDIKDLETGEITETQDTRQSEDPNRISWESDDDPEKPTNWRVSFRWTLIGLECASVFVLGTSSSIFAPGVPQLMEENHSDNTVLATLVVTIYVLGLATGPLFFGPLSELYGRLIIQHVGNVGFILFTIACAVSPNLSTLIGMRLLQGIFAAVPLTNGGGVIADTVKQEERGLALAMFTLGLLAGPVVGPVAGGFLCAAKGWRWSFWLCAILLAVPTLISIVIWRESYPPLLLERKAAKLRQETGNPDLRSIYDKGETRAEHFKRGIVRAAKMLIFSPIVLSLSIYMGLMYSYFYLLLTTLTPTFERVYHFKSNIVGLSYLGLGVGYLLGQFTFARLSDRMLKKRAAQAKEGRGEMKPEYRLPLAVVGGFSVPIAFFWFGWSAQERAHWILPIIGPAFLGFGNSLIFMSTQAYLVDAYTIFAASALAATTILRSVMAAMIPLAAPKMYATMGLGWGNSLLAFLAMACVPIPSVLIRYGERMRKANEGFTKNL